MLGFIGFQWYIIRETVAVRNDQFNLRVSESVQAVVHRLEKEEMIFLLQQRIEMEQQRSKLERMTTIDRGKKKSPGQLKQLVSPQNESDTIISLATPPVATLPRNENNITSDALSPNLNKITDYHARIIEEFFEAQQAGLAGMDKFMQRRMQEDLQLDFFFDDVEQPAARKSANKSDESKTAVKQSDRSSLRKQITGQSDLTADNLSTDEKFSRAEILKEVMKDLIYTKRPIEERINRFLLDSMLKREFQHNGINLPYEFAVKGEANRQVMFTTAQLSPAEWEFNAYKTALFPNEAMGAPSQLFVYFPGKNQFVLGTMTALLLGSGLMVLAILVIFYIAIATILKQKKLSEIKNDFINNMTHEFKTPISTISLAVEMAKESIDGQQGWMNPTSAYRYLDIIRDENKRLGGHVEKVLQTALVDKGEIKLKLSEVSLHDQLLKVLESFAVVIEQRNGEVILSLDAPFDLIEADEVHLSGILRNLVDNAVKYSPDTLSLRFATFSTDNGICLTVEDQGSGIAKEQLERIFEKFYRVPTGDRHDVKGFGLGLSYVKEMVHRHKGKISVSSKPGKGSIFTIWFPQLTKS